MTLYRWYFGERARCRPPPTSTRSWPQPAAWLVAGLHMAGPDLTPETFARGLFRIPPRGGGPSNPQVSYGNWGVFPEMDYQGIDDAVEIWWDPTVEAEDERGAMGTGAWRRSNERRPLHHRGGPAAQAVHRPRQRPHDRRRPAPEDDRPPDYPPPAGSPAAGG